MSTATKLKQYELTSLFNIYINDDVAHEAIKSSFVEFAEDVFKVDSIVDKGRFEIQNKKSIIKINMVCCTFSCETNLIDKIKKNIREKSEILKFLIIVKDKKVIGSFLDYKRPIEMKKHIFESLRIMPNELTGFSKKTQKILSTNIKRARILGLIGRFNK